MLREPKNPREPGVGEPDGMGPLKADIPDGMPWLVEGVRLLNAGGVRLADERQAFILRVAAYLDRYAPIDIAWCGLFLYHCLKTAYPDTRTPFLPMRARPWLGYGSKTQPQVGALMLFWLGYPNSPFGHSGLYWGEDAEAFHVLGGNQRNRVRIQRVGRQRLLGARWPSEALPAPGILREADPSDAAPFEFGEQHDYDPGLIALPGSHPKP